MKSVKFKNVLTLLAFGMVCSVLSLLLREWIAFEAIPPGVLQITPTPVEVCGPPPSAEDWKVMRDDGTIDNEAVMTFAKHISEWDECISQYADGLRDYIFALEGVRDSTIEAAGSYFHQFVDPGLPDPHSFMPPPGLFGAPDDDFPSQGEHGIMPWIFDNSKPWTERQDI